jgi:sigma-B regulation protein RsbU (phosphoserine phosphatase)
MLELVNKSLYTRPIEAQYCALTYAIYDPKASKINLANSGLPYPLLVRRNTPEYLELGGIPVGLLPESKYEERELQLEPGDVLVFYTDGVIEARNYANEDFGMKRLAGVVRENSQDDPRSLVKAINAAVDDFIGSVPLHDDRTLLVLKML